MCGTTLDFECMFYSRLYKLPCASGNFSMLYTKLVYLCNSFHQKTSKFFVTLIVSKTFISLLDLDTKPCLLSPMSHVTKKYESQLNSCKRASAISSRFLARQLAGLWPAHMMCLHKRSFNIFRIDQQHIYQVLWTHQFLSFFLQYLCVWHESQGLTALAIFGV